MPNETTLTAVCPYCGKMRWRCNHPLDDPADGKTETTIELPPGFAFLKFSGERYVLVNGNSDGHRSTWTDKHDMIRSAWDWWNDVGGRTVEP